MFLTLLTMKILLLRKQLKCYVTNVLELTKAKSSLLRVKALTYFNIF